MGPSNFSTKIGLAAGAASLAFAPTTADATTIFGFGNGTLKVSLADPDGTILGWDIDGGGNGNEFQLEVATATAGPGARNARLQIAPGANGLGFVGSFLGGGTSSFQLFSVSGSNYVGPNQAFGIPSFGNIVAVSQVQTSLNSTVITIDQFAAGDRFLGFSFDSGAGTRYGFASVNLDLADPSGAALEIVYWAYEDSGAQIHVAPIPLPEPEPEPEPPPPTIPVPPAAVPAITMLALGAAGIRRMRQNRAEAAHA